MAGSWFSGGGGSLRGLLHPELVSLKGPGLSLSPAFTTSLPGGPLCRGLSHWGPPQISGMWPLSSSQDRTWDSFQLCLCGRQQALLGRPAQLFQAGKNPESSHPVRKSPLHTLPAGGCGFGAVGAGELGQAGVCLSPRMGGAGPVGRHACGDVFVRLRSALVGPLFHGRCGCRRARLAFLPATFTGAGTLRR